MITGFNTDIEYGGVVYHVQTEDKGMARPIILSLVYDRGTILASKRTPYNDLLNGNFDESQLAARLQRQHRLICAAIQAGRIEELKQLSAKEEADERAAEAPQKRAEQPAVSLAGQPAFAGAAVNGKHDFPDFDNPIPKPVLEALPPIPPRKGPSELVIDLGGFPEFVLTDDAVAVVGEEEPLELETSERLKIELVGDDRFKGGDRRTLGLKAFRGSSGHVVNNAQIMVKVLGTSFRPLIFHASTDTNGQANVEIQLPNFHTGRAAVLVRAISDGEEVELRRIVEHG